MSTGGGADVIADDDSCVASLVKCSTSSELKYASMGSSSLLPCCWMPPNVASRKPDARVSSPDLSVKVHGKGLVSF